MTGAERHYLDVLKQRIAERYAGDAPVKPVDEWKVSDIEGFREDLQEQVSGSVSQKWVYTHLKGEGQEKLPRIDTLNLLSQYAGYGSWDELKAANPYEKEERTGKTRGSRRIVLSLLAVLLLLGLGSIPFMGNGDPVYRICFEDADSGARIPGKKLEVSLLRKGETPMRLSSDSNDCFKIPRDRGRIRLLVNAPYYRTDTIVRDPEGRTQKERIPLEKDDQALLIHEYSSSRGKDFQKRRTRLDSMIADDARIYQVHGRTEKGIEIYNKEEFIDKLTMPLSSLKRIEVIETRYDEKGRIRSIRFEQVNEPKDRTDGSP